MILTILLTALLLTARHRDQRLPHLNVHGVARIDAEIRAVLPEVSGAKGAKDAGVVPQEAESTKIVDGISQQSRRQFHGRFVRGSLAAVTRGL